MLTVRGTPAITDIRDRPAYPLHEAARYLKLPPATLRSWCLGRDYRTTAGARRFPAVFRPASREPLALSFWNLVEAHVLRALRTEHGVPVRAVRQALTYAEKQLGVEHLLLSRHLFADAGRVFLQHYGQLIELSASGQLAMQHLLKAYLKRIEWDDSQFPIRLFPFVAAEPITEDRPIMIDPAVSFGRPILQRVGVTTAVIADRIDAGESVEALAADYGLDPAEVKTAVLYERAA